MTLSLNTTRMQASISDGIGWMIFNNPARHNALSLEMWQGIGDILEYFDQQPEVRAVVMRGAGGKAFVSGADISEFDKQRSNAAQRETYGQTAGRATRWLTHLSKPLIALIEGYCIGGGLATALHADIRFASHDSTFGIPAAKLGLGYEYEGTAKLARLIGPARARDLLFSARYIDAEEALEFGLVNFIYDREQVESACLDYVASIVAHAPLTIQTAKAAIKTWERGERSDEIDQVKAMIDACFNSEDYREGRRAFQEKRTPRFHGS